MISLTLLALVIILAVVLLTRPRLAGGAPRPARPFGLDRRLHRWVDAGLITPEESAAIAAYEAVETATVVGGETGPPEPVSPPAAPPVAAPGTGRRLRSTRVPVVAESLGYLGAALATTGLLLVLVHLWTDLATVGRLGLSGGAALLLGLAGLAVHEGVDPALTRLRAVLWLASTAAAAVFAGVVADAAGAESPQALVASSATMAVIVSGAMWQWRPRPLQELVALAALPVAVGTWTLLGTTPSLAGWAVWIVGGVLFALGLRLVTPLPWIAEAVGGIALIVGSIVVASEVGGAGAGLFLVVATGAALVAVAIVPGLAPSLPGQVIAGVLGAVTVAQGAPPLIAWYAGDAGVVTGLVVWLTGVALVLLGASARTRIPLVLEVFGALVTVGGAAVCGAQAPGFAALYGIANAVALLAVGMRPGRVLLSAIGALGLLVNVPWAIGWFFPGENRAPLLIMVSGALIIGAAVLMTRLAGRFRREVGHPHPA